MPRNNKNLTRLFVDMSINLNDIIALDKKQSNYLISVLRKNIGDELIIFNGENGAFLAKIEGASKKAAQLLVLEQLAEQPKPNDLWYFFAPLKKARLDYMVQKATEMGVGTMQPVITQYSQVKRLKNERINANIIEAVEQCEILSIPKIEQEITLKNLIGNWQKTHGNRKLILADETMSAASPVATLQALRGEKIALLIGPEGGFSDEELSLLHEQNFVVSISLGSRILRADTAAVAALALIQSIIFENHPS
ncbi:MAG: 16S rRNA (uracil(1498)-N(3))-methyltransferase [Devosiaceae bacterium]|nr:16S rRNA (uracil(1498)-N(3))-methyltransferase [Devosiaceae bacterium]